MKWKIHAKAPSAFLNKFPQYAPLTRQLLYNRGLRTQKQIDEFFNPDYSSDLHDPYLFKDMDKAVKRILRAIKNKERILIYGDFDADGISATAVIYLFFKEINYGNIDIYIPHRDTEGHGLNKKAIQQIAANKTDLIIIVDCGTTDLDEIALAKRLHVDVVLTDHHEPGDKLPDAVAVINPLRHDNTYPYPGLTGVGIAYKLVCALLASDDIKLDLEAKELFKKTLLDIVALGTVVDVGSLVGENRTIVKYGLAVMAQTRWLGLKKLLESAKVEPTIEKPADPGKAPNTNLDTFTLAFVVGPRLNAASRIDHADVAFRLLVSSDAAEIDQAVRLINEHNVGRQNLSDNLFKEVQARVDKYDQDMLDNKLIVEGGEGWPIGLIGLVAAKIAEKSNLPTIIYSQQGDVIAASYRGPEEFDVLSAFRQASDYLDDFGGRERTGGFRAKSKDLGKIKSILYQAAKKQLKEIELVPTIGIDAQIDSSSFNWQTLDQIAEFSPFGEDNAEPTLLVRSMEIVDTRGVGNGQKHLKMELMMFEPDQRSARKINAIAFNFADRGAVLRPGNQVDVVFKMIANEWNGNRNLEMKIVDLKMSN